MQVTLEKTSDLSGIIRVEVAEADYADKVNKELREIGRTRQIPGFRKGHVTLDHLRRLFGRDVKSHVLNEEVYRNVIDYIHQNKLDILGEPLPVEVKEISIEQPDYTFEYEVGLAPDIHVDLGKDITVPYYNIEVTEALVQEQDKALCKRFGAQVPGEEVEPDALVKGSLMQLDAGGNILQGEDAIQVIDGIVGPMYFQDKEQAALFAGKKIGDKVRFNPYKAAAGHAPELASMLHIDKERAASVTSDFEMAISEIIVVRPAQHGEEFYKEVFGGDKVKTEEDYQQALREMIAQQLAPNSEQLFQRDLQEMLVNRFGNFALPEEFLKKWLVARNEELTPDKVDAEYEAMLPSIKWELLRGKIAADRDIKVNDEDRLNFAKGLAARQFAQYGMTNMDEDTVTNYAKHILEDKDALVRINQQLADMKLFNAVRALVTVEPHTVTVEEFKALANPQAAEEPQE